jgi:hypothetical protein
MKSSLTTIQARPGLPGPAAPDNSSHDHPNVMPPPKPLRRILTGLAAALTLGLFVTPASAQQLISNGSFEVGKDIPDPSNKGYTAVILPGPDLPGWNGTFNAWYCRAPGAGTGMGAAQDGERAVNLTGATAPLFQTFAVEAGAVYTVSYYEKIRGGGTMDATLSVAAGTVTGADGTPVAVSTGPAASIVQTTGVNAAWTQHSFTFTPDTTTTATLTFRIPVSGDGVFLDNVSVLGPAPLTVTTTTLARSSGTVTPSTYGDPLSFDVTLDPVTATGTVELYDGGAGGTLIGTGTLLGGTCTITPATTALAVGPHANIVAVYLGDTTHATSTSAALSPAQVVNSAGATALLFTTPPSDAQPGEVWATQPTVKVLDAGGYLVADSSASITLEITTGTPTSGGPGTLIGTKTVTAVNGVATFSGLSIDTAGVGYRLTATSTGLTPADSALFTVSSGTVLYDSTACSGQFPRTTLDFTPVADHVYTLSFSMNNPANTVLNALIGLSPYALADNTYDAGTLIDGFWNSSGGSIARQYNGGGNGTAFTSAGSGNGYRGAYGELDSNFEVVLDTTSSPWKTSTSMSSGLGTVSGSVYDALGTVKSVQVWVRDPGNGIYPTISNFRLTDTALIGSTPSTTTLAANANTNPSTYGDLLSFDVTVGGVGLDIPTGSVTLKAGTTTLGSATLTPSDPPSATCTITTTTLAVTHGPIVAVYSGNPSTYAVSTSADLSPDQVVNKAGSTVSVTGPASFTYTGTPQGPNTATTTGSSGAVTYSYVGTGSTTYELTDIQPTEIGTYSCTATLAADANYADAVSAPFAFAIVVTNVATVTQSHDFAASNAGSLYNGDGSAVELVNSSFFSTNMQPFNPALGTLQSFTVKWENISGTLSGTVGPVSAGSASGSFGGSFTLAGSPYGSNGGGNGGGNGPGLPLEVIFPASPIVSDQTFTVANAGVTYDPAILAAVTGTSPFAAAFTSPATVSYTNVVDLAASVTGKVTLTYTYEPASSQTYDTWAAAQVPPVTGGANGDSDHDGIPNLVEYALALDPAAADGPPGSFDGSLLSFSKRDAAVTNNDVSYAIEISTTLAAGSWQEVSSYVENTAATISCTLPTNVGGKVFARLVVTQKP